MPGRKDWTDNMDMLLMILGALLGFFAVTFAIYYFNLDMKLVRMLYALLGKHYDAMKRDKKL